MNDGSFSVYTDGPTCGSEAKLTGCIHKQWYYHATTTSSLLCTLLAWFNLSCWKFHVLLDLIKLHRSETFM